MNKNPDFLIIGAGSVGLPLACALADRGAKVTVIEQLPSAGRGQNRAAIGGVRATHSDPAKIRICTRSIRILQTMQSERGFDVDWLQGGYLFPVYDEGKELSLRKLLAIQKSHGLNIDWVDADAIFRLVPGINPRHLRGGTFSPGDGSASPLKVAEAFYALGRKAGVDFHFDESVEAADVADGRVNTVRTSIASYRPGTLIDASGSHARVIGALLGLDVPVFPDSHEAGITEPVERFFEPMVVDTRSDSESANYYFYQNKEGQVVFCITPEPKIPGVDIESTSAFLPLVIGRMVALLPRLRSLRVRRIWRGLYPMTPDGFPIVGRPREIDNVFLAVGMCGQGFMLGPGLGEILAEILIDGSHAHDDLLAQLSLYRSFSGEEVLK
jgi:sarcosine oxidase, subunit beta